MKQDRNHISMKFMAFMIVFLLAQATGLQATGMTGDALTPDIPRGQGAQCVTDTDFMRRNHMDLLDHQRDETTIKGLRGEPFSLKDCISCHAVKGPDAKPVTVESPKHFCRACHDYAAVSIDCFQCHASRPDVDGHSEERRLGSLSADTKGGQ